jgi:hypothetical protein
VNQIFGEKVASAAAWIFALYPESILLGASAMREPYLLTFSALAFYGFVELFRRVQRSEPTLAPHAHLPWWAVPESAGVSERSRSAAWIALAIGLIGMLLISPAIVLVTLLIFAGWTFFTSERANISWITILLFAIIFLVGLLFLSASLNRSGKFDATSPLHVINDWLQLAVKWDAYQLERESGWVQKIFDESPAWIRLPFVTVYGLFQPVLPATLIRHTNPIRTAITLLRGLGWYALIPLLSLSFVAATGSSSSRKRNLVLWLALFSWTWIVLAALRGGGDLWDNPRYRTIMFLWQSILAGYVWVWWQETRNAWLPRIIAMGGVFLLVFIQWYASRYHRWGGQLPFSVMVALILGSWGLIIGIGWWQDRKKTGRL